MSAPSIGLAVQAIFELRLELDELEDFLLAARAEPVEQAQHLGIALAQGAGKILVEELRDVHLEHRQDPEEGFQADLVLAVLHAAQVGLLDSDAGREIGLGQITILAQCADSGPDEEGLLLEFCRHHAYSIHVITQKALNHKAFTGMCAQQKTIDTVVAGPYTDVVSSHTKTIRRVKMSMNLARAFPENETHPLRTFIGWRPPSADRPTAGGKPTLSEPAA